MTSKAQVWFARVEEWRKSGLTSREFCEGKEFTNRALLWWSSEFNRRKGEKGVTGTTKAPRDGSSRFARVVAQPRVRDSEVVVRVGSAEVVVRPGFDQALLRDVVRALEAAK